MATPRSASSTSATTRRLRDLQNAHGPDHLRAVLIMASVLVLRRTSGRYRIRGRNRVAGRKGVFQPFLQLIASRSVAFPLRLERAGGGRFPHRRGSTAARPRKCPDGKD